MSSNNNDVSLIRSVLNGPEHANESLVDNNDYYTVIEGDTLQGIALKTDTSVVHLKRLNKLSSYYKPIPGQLLIIHSSAETHGASASNHGKDTSTSGIPTTSSTPSTKSSWSMWSLSAISKSSSTPPPPENSTSSTTKGAEAPPPPRNTLYSFINQFTSEVVDGLRDINNTISTGGISNDSDTEVAGDIENEDPVTSEAMDRTGSLNDEMDENKMRELKLLAELEAEDDIENSDYYDEENKVNLRSPLSKFPTDILGLLPNLLKKKPAEELSVPSKIDVATVKSQVSTESLVEPSIRKQSLPDVVLLPQQGDILSTRLAEYIVEVVPLVYQIEPMYMLYSLLKHGSDFRTYYSKVVGIKPTIVVVETSDGMYE